ncbi:trafficking kinesin-binding protein 1-like isoform X1 [Lethenteron reissneri]|uniref:trafficking kinesin-binding protein 1-like isoform X1 n=3 Tax=Lethenteron reissneri TaxID=7753 RepID=UPI002AB69B39|nr:trafficking kinesin-binding protein 1-like isoform X1 [Lethenteron reissneri]
MPMLEETRHRFSEGAARLQWDSCCFYGIPDSTLAPGGPHGPCPGACVSLPATLEAPGGCPTRRPRSSLRLHDGPMESEEREAAWRDRRDVGTITDAYGSGGGGDETEVEVVSLMEERLPLFRLRADSVLGYDRDDWIRTPVLPPDADLELGLELVEETLKYMLLCADRVGQMTKTYSDIDAVTRLLEEKERDVELAARIGQSLLQKIKVLTDRNETLEEQIGHATEEAAQLRHDLAMKEELLQIYTGSSDENDNAPKSSSPLPAVSSPCPTFSLGSSGLHMDTIHRKLRDLEEENISLRSEASQLQNETIDYEEKEDQLVNDCVRELRESNSQVLTLTEELARRSEDASRQQEEITHLLSQIVDLQKKVKTYTADNEELTQHLSAAKDAQRQLTAELAELQVKLVECTGMLHEAQEDAKNLRNQTAPSTNAQRWLHSHTHFPMDSLAAEIEGTMRKTLKLEDGVPKAYQRRVFETVRTANQATASKRASISSCLSPLPIPGSNQGSVVSSRLSSPRASRRQSAAGSPRSGLLMTDGTSVSPELRSHGLIDTTEFGPVHTDEKRPGQPGTPGSHDLEAALRRLSLRREAHLGERRFMEEEWEQQLSELASGQPSRPATPPGSEGCLSDGERTPGGSSSEDSHSSMSLAFRSYLPEKLQIVKPLEGSATLQHWQQLARPHLGGILDTRPGVIVKDSQLLELVHPSSSAVFRITDYEEDEPDGKPGLGDAQRAEAASGHPDSMHNCAAETEDGSSVHYPGKCLVQTNFTCTYTTCRIMHPSDEPASGTLPSFCGISTTCSSDTAISSSCPTRQPSFIESFTNARESTKTCSVALGLAHLLCERGISAHPPMTQSFPAVGRPCSLAVPSTPVNAKFSRSPIYPLSPIPFPALGKQIEIFLASKPATSMLKEMMGHRRRTSENRRRKKPELSPPSSTLMERLRRMGFSPVLSSSSGSSTSPFYQVLPSASGECSGNGQHSAGLGDSACEARPSFVLGTDDEEEEEPAFPGLDARGHDNTRGLACVLEPPVGGPGSPQSATGDSPSMAMLAGHLDEVGEPPTLVVTAPGHSVEMGRRKFRQSAVGETLEQRDPCDVPSTGKL